MVYMMILSMCFEEKDLFLFWTRKYKRLRMPRANFRRDRITNKESEKQLVARRRWFLTVLLKKGRNDIIQWIWQVIKKVWITEEFPEDWKMSVICSIHKKWDKRDGNNCREIVLLNVINKVFSNCILTRI